MSRWLALLVALFALGCEDTYVREHIIDNFVCVYLPWWMGECDGDEVTAKVMGVLEHGLISAQAECTCDLVAPSTNVAHDVHYRAQRLIDGSCFAGSAAQRLIDRSDPDVDTCAQHNGGATHELSGGVFYLHNGPDPSDLYQGDMSTCCTGFNLEAFGVE